MNRHFVTVVFIFVALSLAVSKSYGCTTPPTARIVSPGDAYVCVGCSVSFNGVGSASAVPPTGSYDFDNGSPYGGGHGITEYEWDFGDGDTGTGATTSHTYNDTGTYTVELKVTDDDDPSQTDTETCTIYVVEVDGVRAGGKTTDQTLFLANDYLDEPAKREPLDQDVIADLIAGTLAVSTTPDSFSWSPVCGSLPKICPDDANGATFTAKDHDLYSITATCCSSSESMSIVIEGINIYTANISSPDEMDKTYNIFLNENFDQQREFSTLPGHKQCYYMDNSDDSLTNPNNDNMIEIGTIYLFAYTGGDTDAGVTFDSSGIKLYDSSKNKLEFDTVYKVVDLGPPYWIYVEGTLAGTPTLTATIETQDDYTAIDQLKIKVIPLNLIAVDPAPSSDQHEICHKDKLIICVNNNDSDNDGTVDLVDSEIPGGDPDLAHVILEKPSNAVASDISGSITVTFPSTVTAWKSRDKTAGTVTIPATYSLSDIPTDGLDFYLEGATASSDILDSSVTVEMTLNSGVVCRDEIRYTVIKVEIKNPVDSDSDNLIDDDANPGNNYTGNEFNSDQAKYAGTKIPGYGRAPAGKWFATGYSGRHDRILIGQIAQGTDVVGGITTGIDCFDDTVQHENYHAIDQTVGYTNTAFGLGITGATNVADNHWSCTIQKPGAPPIPPLPPGRVYNHYKDINGDGDFLDAGEDLDTDGDDVINSAEPGTIESLAEAAEPNNQDGRADDDWGNPGKNHNTISYND